MLHLMIGKKRHNLVMIQKQRTLFIEQTNKLSEMLDVLNKKHSTLEINDEGKFLAILK